MIRELRPEDTEALRHMHAKQNFEYAFPDLSEQQYVEQWAIVDEEDRVTQAVIARLTTELFFLCDREKETPKVRFEGFRMLHELMRKRLLGRGIHDAHLWCPPQLEKSFGRRLIQGFGWLNNPWKCLSRTTEAKQ